MANKVKSSLQRFSQDPHLVVPSVCANASQTFGWTFLGIEQSTNVFLGFSTENLFWKILQIYRKPVLKNCEDVMNVDVME